MNAVVGFGRLHGQVKRLLIQTGIDGGVGLVDQVLDLFRSFHQVGVTVLVATHDAAAAAYLAPRVVSLVRGKLS